MSDFQKIPYTVNRLGILRTKIGDLQGFEILAGELIQNADDAPSVTELVFDVTATGLQVKNDGSFRDVDFERIQDIARGGKRDEEGTTGAFGIGFISVYQITDQPEIHSAGRHWILNPVEQISARLVEDDKQTCFDLPWATNPDSEVRRGLGLQAVNGQTIVGELHDVFSKALPGAMLFLKNIQSIELKREGITSFCWTRIVEKGLLFIQQEEEAIQEWFLFEGNFQEEEQKLRAQHPTIEVKRKSRITVAIPKTGDGTLGVLCATLPTQTSSGLPVMINADFFPSSDRKRILFDNDFKSDWNRVALRAAAQTIGESLEQLPELLGAKSLWDLLGEAYKAKVEKDAVNGVFWGVLSPRVVEEAVVLTTQGEWKKPGSTFYVESPAEHEAEPLFAALGLPVVSRDLRPHQNLLLSLKVPVLSAAHLAQALQQAGLNKTLQDHELPAWFANETTRFLLHREINAVRSRTQSPAQRAEGELALSNCTLARSASGLWCAPAHLYSCSPETRDVFAPLLGSELFLGDGAPDSVSSLCEDFDLESALRELEEVEAEQFAAWSARTPGGLASLVLWFSDKQADLRIDANLRAALRACPIWPSGGAFTSLDKLWVPGDFDDPLKLASLVDLELLPSPGLRSFLLELGARELTFLEYAKSQVPEAFRRTDLSTEQKRGVVALLVGHLGTLRDNGELRDALKQCPLVECLDGGFRKASEVYLPSQVVVDVLGSKVPVCVLPRETKEATRDFFGWLGVRADPSPADVLARLRERLPLSLDGENRQFVVRLVSFLATTNYQGDYVPLKTLAWLPVQNDTVQWHRPDALFAVYQDYLFKTQAPFLDVDRQEQGRLSDFLRFLGVKTEPSPLMVARHILECSRTRATVNKAVYEFLNNKGDDAKGAVDLLKNEPCLLLDSGRYFRPSEVFWGAHPFGIYRQTLAKDLRRYDGLFGALGVKEAPDADDFIAVLREIAAQFGPSNAVLDGDTKGVLLSCWSGLSAALETAPLLGETLRRELANSKVVPDAQGMLRAPRDVFFEDRAGLAGKFRLLAGQVIPKPGVAWRAMQEAGVQSLSQIVQPELVAHEDAAPAQELEQRVRERVPLFRRVVEADEDEDVLLWNFARLESLLVQQATSLSIRFALQAYNRTEDSATESTDAFFHRASETLFCVPKSGAWPIAAIARELVSAIKSNGENGSIASAFGGILRADSANEASSELDDLGFARVQSFTASEQNVESLGLGGEENEEQPLEDAETIFTPETPKLAPAELASPSNGTGTSPGSGAARGGAPNGNFSPGQSGGNGTGGAAPSRSGVSDSTGSSFAGASGSSTSSTLGSQDGEHRTSAPRGRLVSYVSAPKEGASISTPQSQAQQEHRTAVDEAGIAHVLAFEKSQGRTANDMNKNKDNNPGYDISSADLSQRPPQVRTIEVKSLSGELSDAGVGLSDTQFHKAQEQGDNYWLYIVQRAQAADFDPATDLLRIQNPAGKVETFFFDSGWRTVAENPVQAPSVATDTNIS